ncbi:MAG TPA: YggS family pyridoxal phosphate-dependent enzyme [Fibrobacteria bacterium]|nr:YggS family pyridoxal phosphate-dependent enzyme [Fibrobacteria bacterium]
MTTLRENRDRVEARIRAACARAGRDPADIRLIWVSKNHPREKALEALDLGARHFGENRVQEALEKFPLPGREPLAYTLHLIGRLQKNKIRKILPVASAIHSIDSVELLQAVDRIAGELGLVRDVFLQVNTSREPNKGGFEPQEFRAALASLPPTPHLRLVGLMTMGPLEGGPEEARPCFRELAGMLADIRREGRHPDMAFLSMGMTGDFEVAIEEGAHYLRVGTGLFGEREAA